MKWKRYPQYKDSGIEWLGEIPEGWAISHLKYNLRQKPSAIKTGPFGSQLLSSEMNSGDIKVYNQRNVLDQDFNSGENYISKQKYEDLIAFTIEPDDILVTTRGTIGHCALFPHNAEKGILHPCLMRIQVDPIKLLPEYLLILIQNSYIVELQLILMSNATTIDVIYSESLKKIILTIPPIEEQIRIITFLDRETSRIDKLIEKKEKQIELLKEKRAALISHAVTKGLDTNVKMKDSGIDWLGEIPEGWDLIRIKRVVAKRITDGPHETPPILEEGVPFISAEAIKNNRIDFSLKRGFISKELHNIYCKKVKPRREDILLIKSGATTGNIAMVETDEEFSIWSPLAMIRADQKVITPKFIFYYLQTDEFKKIIELSWSFGTQQNIGMGVIENLQCIIPPISYQTKITEILDRETGKIDTLIDKVQKSIELLKEYRTAIISAAVTGKIDVRDAV
jgi:type I restriction enzyme S subunit